MSDSTTIQSPNLMTGVLAEKSDDRVIISLPETCYEFHLNVYKPVTTPVGKRITGTIRAQARRIDVVKTGGRYIEPVNGRPRRVQGVITAIDASERTVTVDAGVPIVCKVDARQAPGDFNVGDFVTFATLSGSSFSPVL